MITARPQRGFTLIELLFVIAIIAVLAMLGISTYQQTAVNTKVKKTALQMQQVLQASMAYYIDDTHQGWPEDGDSKNPGDFEPFLPIGASDNPWGSMYSWQASDDKNKFRVTTNVPVSESVGKRIAALLPNATVTAQASNATTITAETAIPGAAIGPSALNRPYITKFESIDTPSNSDNQYVVTIPKPINAANPNPGQCPINWGANLQAVLEGFIAPTDNKPTNPNPMPVSQASVDVNQDTWEVTVRIVPKQSGIIAPNTNNRAKILTIISCVPPEQSKQKMYRY